MTDMRPTIVPKSDQLNADDLIGGPRTITITSVAVRPSTEQPVAISFDGDGGKPYKPCKSMCRVMVALWGPDAKQYAGRSMTLYRDPKVKWAGLEVGGIRVSHMSHIERDHVMALTESKQSRKPYTVKPIPGEATAVPGESNGKAREAHDRFMKRLQGCKDLADLATLQQDLGKGERVLGDHYQDCARALDEKKKAMMAETDHHDAFTELEPEEWRGQEGRVEDERAGELGV